MTTPLERERLERRRRTNNRIRVVCLVVIAAGLTASAILAVCL